MDEIAEQNPAVIAIDIIYSEETNNEVLITRDRFKESQPYLYQTLAGVKMEVRNEHGIRVIAPGNSAFDQAALDAASGEAQDQKLADAVSRAMDAGIRVVLAAQHGIRPRHPGTHVTLSVARPGNIGRL